MRNDCLSVASMRSSIWLMRCCKRSFSFTSASPVSTRVMPRFFCAKLSSIAMIASTCRKPLFSSWVILLIRPNTVCSINSISPSNICALLAKWRYSAASESPSFAASAAVVIFSPLGCSSICATVCRICSFLSPGLLAIFTPSVQTMQHARQLHHIAYLHIYARRAFIAGIHPHCAHPQPLGRIQVFQAVLDHDALRRRDALPPQQAQEAEAVRLGTKARLLHRHHVVEQILYAQQLQHRLRIMLRRIGKYYLSARQCLQHMAQARLAQHHPLKLRELVGVPQKMIRVGAMMAHQTAQRRAIALPVMHAQCVRLRLVQFQMLLQIGRHAAVDMRKDVRRRVMQRVVQIKNPKFRCHALLCLKNLACIYPICGAAIFCARLIEQLAI